MTDRLNTDKIQKNQKLRIRRWTMALGAYCVVVIAAYFLKLIGLGSMPPKVFALLIIIAVIGNAVTYTLIKTNINLRFKDPSLTLAQIIFSAFWGMIPLYYVPGARLVVQLLILTSFCFGMFRLNLRDYLKAFFTVIGLYFFILVLEYTQQRDGFILSVEIFQFVLFNIILLWFTFFGSFISSLRHRLRKQNAELKTAHEAIQLETEERKRAIEDRTRVESQLQRAKKMEAIGTLAGGVAHDLNNILSGIVSYPELILMDLPADSPLRESVKTIKESGQKAVHIVEDLLTMARRGVAVTELVNLNQIISDYLKSPEHGKLRLFHPQVHIDVNLEPNLLNIYGSPIHFSKTIMNLVSNAAEAMPNGGTLRIQTKNRYIDQSIVGYDEIVEGDYATLDVSDEGVGLSREDKERIFEPFYTKKSMGRSGTGLGMAVVWGTVKDHQGFINIDSILGTGTNITLYFPASREQINAEQSKLEIKEYIGNGESILVVDDVKQQRKIVTEMLQKLGYTVHSVSSGEDAVEYMKKQTTDLLILDMIMDPGIDGLETYKRIIEFHPSQKALITSGFSETDRVKEAQSLGVGQYIKKPFLLEQIGLAVRNELDKLATID